MSEDNRKLSTTDRLRLIRTLNALPATQFDELVFALQPPAGSLPGEAASQGTRSKALLDWVESPIGPGISELEQTLQAIIEAHPESLESSNPQTQQIEALHEIIQTLKESQAPKYDLREAQFSGGFAETVQGDQIGGTQVNFPNQRPIPHRIRAISSSPDLQIVRAKLLRRLRDDINTRLENSLHNLVKIDLQMEDQRQQLGRTKKLELISEDPVDEPRGEPQSLVNRAFQPLGAREASDTELNSTQNLLPLLERRDVQSRLLILGEPGAGKTTELLALSYDLLERAELNASAPIPVIFELFSWREGIPIEKWLVEQFKRIYRLKESISQRLVKEKQIFPLLDGLDELGLSRQRKCITAVNQFLQTQAYPYTVVCCRREEYETGQVKLSQLRGAIYLRPLTDQQIQDYVKGLKHYSLLKTINSNPELKKLVCQPLFLTMLVVSYQCKPIDRVADLFNSYIYKQLEDSNNQGTYSPRETPSQQSTLRYLSWLANQLQESGTTEYLIEDMQISWLLPASQNSYQLISSLLFGLCFGLCCGLFIGIVSKLIYGLFCGLLSGLISIFFWNLRSRQRLVIYLPEKTSWSTRRAFENGWKNGFKFGKIGGISGMFLGALIGLLGGPAVALIGGLLGGVFFSLLLGSFSGLIFGLRGGLISPTIEVDNYPNQGIRKALENFYRVMLFGGGGFGLIFGVFGSMNGWFNGSLLKGLLSGILSGFIIGLGVGIFCGLIGLLDFGLKEIGQHYVLRFLLVWEGSLPRDFIRFLEYATKLRFIQRVGGRYRFVHDLLRKHFAYGDLPSYPSPPDPRVLR